jgi:hypothetical protein
LAAGEQPVLDHRQGVALDRFHDRVDLDRVQQVVGEEREQTQAGEQQASGEFEPTLTDDSAAPAARAATTDSVGSTHSAPRRYSRSASRLTMLTSTIRLWHVLAENAGQH